jgi:hypothetical protein
MFPQGVDWRARVIAFTLAYFLVRPQSSGSTKRKIFDFASSAVLNGAPPSSTTPRKTFPLSKPENEPVSALNRINSMSSNHTTATYGNLGGLSARSEDSNSINILDDSTSSSDEETVSEIRTTSSLRAYDDFSNDPDQVVIHVYDETNHVNKDFKCSREVLLREMKYFRSYLTDKSSCDDVDIAVHCDVNIFQWLTNYMSMSRKDAQQLFAKLEVSWAISILISSFFLGMDDLVKSTIEFVKDRLQEIINLPIELDCMNDVLIEKLAQQFTDEELEALRDRKDKILSRLFQQKLATLLTREDGSNTLLRCSVCEKLYTTNQAQWATCPKAPIHIDYHGQVISKHVPDTRWNVNLYLVNLKKKCDLTWHEIYWRCWGLVHTFSCLRCKNHFAGADYNKCTYHKKDPVFERGANAGVYPCCNTQALRFDSGLNVKNGCCEISHTAERGENTDILQKYQHLIVASQSTLDKEMISIREGTPDEENGDDDEETETDSENELFSDDGTGASNSGVDEDEDEDDDYFSDDEFMNERVHKYEIFNSFSRQPEATKPQVAKKTAVKKRKKLNGIPANGSGGIDFDGIPNSKKRYQALDNQRETDRKNMNEVIKRLASCRKDSSGLVKEKPIPAKPKKRPATAKTPSRTLAGTRGRQSFR